MGLKPFSGRSLIFIQKYGRLWWLFYSTFLWSMIGMTQILFDEGLRGSFYLEHFRWLGSATVQWGQSLFEVTAFFANVAFSGGHFTQPFDVFMAILRDTNFLR
jgi:hypothetical protein